MYFINVKNVKKKNVSIHKTKPELDVFNPATEIKLKTEITLLQMPKHRKLLQTCLQCTKPKKLSHTSRVKTLTSLLGASCSDPTSRCWF